MFGLDSQNRYTAVSKLVGSLGEQFFLQHKSQRKALVNHSLLKSSRFYESP